jgi:hypothetical protein
MASQIKPKLMPGYTLCKINGHICFGASIWIQCVWSFPVPFLESLENANLSVESGRENSVRILPDQYATKRAQAPIARLSCRSVIPYWVVVLPTFPI